MKRIVAIVVLLAFVVNCGWRMSKKPPPEQTQRLPVQSENVAGTIVIDAEKRDELGLFPGIEGFREAHFNVPGGGPYSVEIITETERLLSVNNDQRAATILLDYIDNYERIAEARTQWEVKWGIIDYDTLALPITKHEVARALNPDRAIGCGIGSGCVTSIVVGGVTAALVAASLRDPNYDMSVGIGIMFGGAALVVIAGLSAGFLAGCLTGTTVYKRDKKKVVEMIKEGRKPQPLE